MGSCPVETEGSVSKKKKAGSPAFSLSCACGRSANPTCRREALLLRCDRYCQVVGWTALRSLLIHRRHEIRVHVIILDCRIHVEADRNYGRSDGSDRLQESKRLRIGHDRPSDVLRPIHVEGADLAIIRLGNLARKAPRQRNSLGGDETRCASSQGTAGIRGTSNGHRLRANQACRRTNC